MTGESTGSDRDESCDPEPGSDTGPNPTRDSLSDRRFGLDERAGADADGPPSPLSVATARIRRDPALAVPFVVAGFLLAAIDWLRRHDPVPALVSDGGESFSITVEFAGYPTGVPETGRSLEAFVDLQLRYLAWGIGLEVAALLIVAVAGTVTIARAVDDERSRDGTGLVRCVPAYLGLVVMFDTWYRLTGSIGDVGLFLGIPLLIVVSVVLVRLFAAPAFAVAGSGPIAALRRSARTTRGSGWSIFGLVLAFGLAAWALGLVPISYAEPILSSALVASVHAVSVAVVWERIGDAERPN
ncbi:hypothetical protein [Natronorubrum sp. DTA7]|uniref:hypothetical protein n=1 Tax=Natronorubrum sp. DTA7 TaxID=3447016 RepID=UPI003F830BCB